MKPLIWRYCAMEVGRISYAAWKELPHTSPRTDVYTQTIDLLSASLPQTDPRTGSSFPITPHDLPPPNHLRSRSSKNPIFPALCPRKYLSSADFSIYLGVLLSCESGSYNGDPNRDW